MVIPISDLVIRSSSSDRLLTTTSEHSCTFIKGETCPFICLHFITGIGHVSMLALYDICAGDSHRLIIVKEISACECHLHKGNSKYADTFTTAHTHRLI